MFKNTMLVPGWPMVLVLLFTTPTLAVTKNWSTVTGQWATAGAGGGGRITIWFGSRWGAFETNFVSPDYLGAISAAFGSGGITDSGLATTGTIAWLYFPPSVGSLFIAQ